MSNPDYLTQLIALASEKAGSDYRLAQMLEVPRQNLSAWKNGRKSCPVGDVALMAEIAGLDPHSWVDRAIVSQYEGTSKGDKLYRALGKALVATGGVIASSGASAHLIFSHNAVVKSTAAGVSYFIRCIERLSLKSFNYR